MLADVQNVRAEHEMFGKFSGGETNKQEQAVETTSCQANNVGQFRQALSKVIRKHRKLDRNHPNCFTRDT